MKFKVGDVVWNANWGILAIVQELNHCNPEDCFALEFCNGEEIIIKEESQAVSYRYHTTHFSLWEDLK